MEPTNQALDKKIARVAGISSLKKRFPAGCQGECTQLELTETLSCLRSRVDYSRFIGNSCIYTRKLAVSLKFSVVHKF